MHTQNSRQLAGPDTGLPREKSVQLGTNHEQRSLSTPGDRYVGGMRSEGDCVGWSRAVTGEHGARLHKQRSLDLQWTASSMGRSHDQTRNQATCQKASADLPRVFEDPREGLQKTKKTRIYIRTRFFALLGSATFLIRQESRTYINSCPPCFP
jgi:hypothetical protein